MITLKFKIKTDNDELLLKIQKQYSSLVHFCFEFMNKEEKLKSLFDYKTNKNSNLVDLIKNLKNLDLLNSQFKMYAISEAYQMNVAFKYQQNEYLKKLKRKNELLSKDNRTKSEKKELRKLFKVHEPKVIFGGYRNFLDRSRNIITKEEFKRKRLSPLYSLGQTSAKGNRFFRFDEDLNVVFKPNLKTVIRIKLFGITKGYKETLDKLFQLQENNLISITYKINADSIFITFDESKVYNFKNKKLKDRFLALDLNPNYIGWSIVDWKNSENFKVIKSGVYSFKRLNDRINDLKTDSSDKRKIYVSNKRRNEAIEISKNLINTAVHYKVENVVIEDLNIKSSDKHKGKNFNELINNKWLRNSFIDNLKKRSSIFKLNFYEVLPQYSSFVGNIIFRSLNLPDMILSSIELSRRGYEFRHQHDLKDKPQTKNIVKIDINNGYFKELFIKSMEEFNVQELFKDVVDAYYYFKRNSGVMYRISLDKFSSSLSQFSSIHSRVDRYNLSIL